MFVNNPFVKAKKTSAPRLNPNGTRAITMEDYRNGNFISVGDILLRRQLAAATMQSSNQLFSGFQNFMGAQTRPPVVQQKPIGGWAFPQYGSYSNQQVVQSMFSHYSFSLMQLKAQTAQQMQQVLMF